MASYYPAPDGREPVQYSHGGLRREEGYGGHRQQTYQAPQPQQAQTKGSQQTTNPLLLDDEAFHRAADALLTKRFKSGIAGDQYIFSSMSPSERSHFAAAFRRRYRNLPIFPGPEETVTDRWMRRIQDDFGKAFLRVAPEETSEENHDPQQPQGKSQMHDEQQRHQHQRQYPQQQRHQQHQPPQPVSAKVRHYDGAERARSMASMSTQARTPLHAPIPVDNVKYAQPHHDAMYNPPQYNPRNERHSQQVVLSPRIGYTNYSMGEPYPANSQASNKYPTKPPVREPPPSAYSMSSQSSNQYPTSSSRTSVIEEKRRSSQFDFEQPSQRIYASPATPPSILKTTSRLTRNSSPSQAFMETSSLPSPLTPSTPPNKSNKSASAVAMNQSTTRQALMQEIECTTRLMEDSDNYSDRLAYIAHLTSLKRNLQSLTATSTNKSKKNVTSKDQDNNATVLEIDQVLSPIKTKNEIRTAASPADSVIEMEEIIAPHEQQQFQYQYQEEQQEQEEPFVWGHITSVDSSSNVDKSRDTKTSSSSLRRLRSKSPQKERNSRRNRSDRSLERAQQRPSPVQIPGTPSFERNEVQMNASHMQEVQPNEAIPKSIVVEPQSLPLPPPPSYADHFTNQPTETFNVLDSQTPMVVQVIAPDNLPPGFQLDVELNNQMYTVTVPPQGVSKGQLFESIAEIAVVDGTKTTVINDQVNFEMEGEQQHGTWKGGLFDCFAYGIDHPMFCHSFFCPQVALTQISTRMKLSSYGERATSSNSRLRIRTVLFLSVCYILLNVLLVTAMAVSSILPARIFAVVVFTMVNGPALFAFSHVVVRTRRSIRSFQNIPEHQRLEGYEDLFVSFWFTPCAIAQMMRQTADYDTYRAVWFSESGLPNHVFVNNDQPTVMPKIV